MSECVDLKRAVGGGRLHKPTQEPEKQRTNTKRRKYTRPSAKESIEEGKKKQRGTRSDNRTKRRAAERRGGKGKSRKKRHLIREKREKKYEM